jgi:hypothetical protein
LRPFFGPFFEGFGPKTSKVVKIVKNRQKRHPKKTSKNSSKISPKNDPKNDLKNDLKNDPKIESGQKRSKNPKSRQNPKKSSKKWFFTGLTGYAGKSTIL